MKSESFFFFFFFFCFFFTVRGGTLSHHSFCDGKEEAVENFRKYLRIPTVHPSPPYILALDFILDLARSIGLHPSRVVELVENKGIALLTWQGSDPSLPSVLLNSHMDVVPVEVKKPLSTSGCSCMRMYCTECRDTNFMIGSRRYVY